MVILDIVEGQATLRGRDESEWVEVPLWPCSGRTVRKAAPPTTPRDWLDEAADFADAELVRSF
jgi:hypothetical protein